MSTALREAVGAIADRQGIQVWVSVHSRLQSSIVLGRRPEGPATYRDTMRAMSPWAFRPMLALSFYLRLKGVFTKTVPTMNLSAAHSEEDVRQITSALEESLVEIRAHGLLHGLEGP